jgi:ribosome-associated translation inhibitor RaiA
MQVVLNLANVEHSDSLEARVEAELERTLGHLADRLTRVEVHIEDLNSVKRGPDDKRCGLEARPAGLDPIHVESKAGDYYEAIAGAAGKLKRALDRRLDRTSAV